MHFRLMIFVLPAQLQGYDSGTRGNGKEEGGSLQLFFAAVQVKERHQLKIKKNLTQNKK